MTGRKNMKKDVVKKAVVLGIPLIFIFVAYMPAVCSQGGMGATVLCGDGDTSSNPEKQERSVNEYLIF